MRRCSSLTSRAVAEARLCALPFAVRCLDCEAVRAATHRRNRSMAYRGSSASSRYRSRCESIRQSRRPTSCRELMPYVLEQLLAQQEQTAETN